jgi:hypothetical protein
MDGCSGAMKCQRRAENGFTLIETLIGGMLIAVSVVAVFQVLSQGSWLNRKEMVRRRAYQEMERMLEKPVYSYKSPYYSALTPGMQPDTVVTLDDRGTATTADDLMATMRVRVDAVSFQNGGTIIPAKRVTARIEYGDDGTQYAESLQTVITLVDIN